MPRRNNDEEIERVLVSLPPEVKYMKFKQQIEKGFKIHLPRMTKEKTEKEAKEEKLATLRNLKFVKNPLYNEDNKDPFPSLNSPTKDCFLADKVQAGLPPDRQSVEDSLLWLSTFDDLSQLFLCCLLTRDFETLAFLLSQYQDVIDVKHWANCFNFICLMEDDEIVCCLQTLIRSCRELSAFMFGVCSIVIELIIHWLQVNKLSIYVNKVLQLVFKHRLPLYNENVKSLNTSYERFFVQLLLADVYASANQPDISVDILVNSDAIQQLLTSSTVNPSERLNALTEVVNNVFFVIEKNDNENLGMKLAKSLLNCPKVLPDSHIWGSLILAILLKNSNANAGKNLLEILSALLSAKVAIPNVLQRAACVKISEHGENVSDLFGKLPAYQLCAASHLTNVNLSKKRHFLIEITWNHAELRLVVLWLLAKVRLNDQRKKSDVIKFSFYVQKAEPERVQLKEVLNKFASFPCSKSLKKCRGRLTSVVNELRGKVINEMKKNSFLLVSFN